MTQSEEPTTPMSDLDETLHDLERALHEKNRLSQSLESAKQRLEVEGRRRAGLRAALRKEEADVERLEGLSLTALFHSVFSNKEEQLDKERQEAFKARLAYDACAAIVKSAEIEVDELTRRLRSLDHLDERVARARRAREESLRAMDDSRAAELVKIADQRAAIAAQAARIRDTQRLGISAYRRLKELESELVGASGFSSWDMWGGGAVITAAKLARLDRANNLVKLVEEDVYRFEGELDAIMMVEEIRLDLELAGSLRFADYFFDHLIVDLSVHGRIKRSLENTREALEIVQETVEHLDSKVDELSAQLDDLTARRDEILHGVA